MRSKELWLLLFALLGCGAVLVLITAGDGDASRDDGVGLADDVDGVEHGAALEGVDVDPESVAAASPYAEETDWRALLAAVGPTQPVGALERLVALCQSDPELIRQLVELLHPRLRQLSAPGQGQSTNRSTSAVQLPGDPPIVVWRSYIVEVLVAVGAPAVPALRDVIADANEEYRDLAATMLARMGADAVAASDRLMERVRERPLDPRHRAHLLRTLAAIGHATPEFREHLHGLLRADDTQEDLEGAAAGALVRTGEIDARTIETLSMVLQGEFLEVRTQVIGDIPLLGERAVPLMDDLIAILDSERDEELHSAVIEALARLGQADPRVIERLRIEVADPEVHTSTRWADAYALARMGCPSRRFDYFVRFIRVSGAKSPREQARRTGPGGSFAEGPAPLSLQLIPGERRHRGQCLSGILAVGHVGDRAL